MLSSTCKLMLVHITHVLLVLEADLACMHSSFACVFALILCLPNMCAMRHVYGTAASMSSATCCSCACVGGRAGRLAHCHQLLWDELLCDMGYSKYRKVTAAAVFCA